MRASLVIVAILLTSSFARAGVPPGYPTAETDRPLVDPAGMSTAGADLSFPSDAAADERLFDYARLDFGASHAFGAVEPTLGITTLIDKPTGADAPGLQQLRAGARIALDPLDELSLFGYWQFPTENGTAYEIDATYAHKVVLVPHRFAVGGSAGAFFERVQATYTLDPTTGVQFALSTARLGAFASAYGELQLGPRLALGLMARGRAPIAAWEMATAVPWGGDADAWLLYAFDHFDVSAGLFIADVTRDANPVLSASVTARF